MHETVVANDLGSAKEQVAPGSTPDAGVAVQLVTSVGPSGSVTLACTGIGDPSFPAAGGVTTTIGGTLGLMTVTTTFAVAVAPNGSAIT